METSKYKRIEKYLDHLSEEGAKAWLSEIYLREDAEPDFVDMVDQYDKVMKETR